jgi:restriction endonuclease
MIINDVSLYAKAGILSDYIRESKCFGDVPVQYEKLIGEWNRLFEFIKGNWLEGLQVNDLIPDSNAFISSSLKENVNMSKSFSELWESIEER